MTITKTSKGTEACPIGERIEVKNRRGNYDCRDAKGLIFHPASHLA